MNDNGADHEGTAAALLSAGRDLFAQHGFDGASVRAITAKADANLGAITYHFGSKSALYEAVLRSVMVPLRQRIAAAASEPGKSLQRVEAMVRALFDYLYENPDGPQLMMQQLVSTRPLPEPVLQTMQANVNELAVVIAEGQADGSIRAGDPQLMALSIGAQPIWLALARRALQAGIAVDQDRPETREQLVESVVRFVRAGLAVYPETRE
ncbi:MAG: TetR/AcrR family transcriptional regulator [Gemmatimonadales bacterium]|jgi:AcrR family transcriptional regulator